MADRLLWDNGDGILLEDSSGDIALEFDSPSPVLSAYRGQQAAYIREAPRYQQRAGLSLALIAVTAVAQVPPAFAYAPNAYAREYVQRQPQGGFTPAMAASLAGAQLSAGLYVIGAATAPLTTQIALAADAAAIARATADLSVSFIPRAFLQDWRTYDRERVQRSPLVYLPIITPALPFIPPNPARRPQIRQGWQLSIDRSFALRGLPVPAPPPPNPPRRLQIRQGWHLYIQRALTNPGVPVDPGDIVVLEEQIGEFWDLPPYPRQQPKRYVAHLPSAVPIQLQASLNKREYTTAILTASIALTAATRAQRNFTPSMINAISLAANLYQVSQATAPITTAIPLAAVLSDFRDLRAPGFVPKFVASLSAISTLSGALTTQIPIAANLTTVCGTNQTLTAAINLVALCESRVSVNAPLGAVASLLANLGASASMSPGALNTAIPLVGGFHLRNTATVALNTNIPLLAALYSLTSIQAPIVASVQLAAAIGAVASLSSNLLSSLPAQLVAALSSVSIATPSLTTQIPMAAQARDVRDLSAALTTAVSLQATPADVTTATVVLATAIRMAAQGVDSVSIVAALTNPAAFSMSAAAIARFDAALTQLINLSSSSAYTRSVLLGALSDRLPVTVSGTNDRVYAKALVTIVKAPFLNTYVQAQAIGVSN